MSQDDRRNEEPLRRGPLEDRQGVGLLLTTPRLPYPDDDWHAEVRVIVRNDRVIEWSVDRYVLTLVKGPPRVFTRNWMHPMLPSLVARLDENIGKWVRANETRIVVSARR